MLSANGEWQTVSNITIKAEELKAYNMTVDKDHTYFIKGAAADNEGIWVHNDCWDLLPNGAIETGKTTPDGRKLYTFKDEKGIQVTAYQGYDGRYYNPKVYSPEQKTVLNAKSVDSHPNRNGALAAKGEIYYRTDKEAKLAAEVAGYKIISERIHGQSIFYNPKTKTYITRDVGSNDGNGAHNGGVWKMADSVKDLGKKSTRKGTYDANFNKIGD